MSTDIGNWRLSTAGRITFVVWGTGKSEGFLLSVGSAGAENLKPKIAFPDS